MNQYNPLIHHRKSIRLKGYDYSKAGLYFITICCQNRACLFGNVVVGANPCGRPNTNTETQMVLNDAGKMIEEQWLLLKNRFSNIELLEFVIMPNHFHGILEIVDTNEHIVDLNYKGRPQGHEQGNEQPQGHENGNGQPQGHAPTTVGDIIGAFKSITTVEYIRGVKSFDWQPFNGKLWQRNYYEHIIRDENAFQKISNYIINNPKEWDKDKFFEK